MTLTTPTEPTVGAMKHSVAGLPPISLSKGLSAVTSRFTKETKGKSTFVAEFEDKQRGVAFKLPLLHCTTCERRKTGWRVTFGSDLTIPQCVWCMDGLSKRLVENIHLLNDNKPALPLDFPRRREP